MGFLFRLILPARAGKARVTACADLGRVLKSGQQIVLAWTYPAATVVEQCGSRGVLSEAWQCRHL